MFPSILQQLLFVKDFFDASPYQFSSNKKTVMTKLYSFTLIKYQNCKIWNNFDAYFKNFYYKKQAYYVNIMLIWLFYTLRVNM